MKRVVITLTEEEKDRWITVAENSIYGDVNTMVKTLISQMCDLAIKEIEDGKRIFFAEPSQTVLDEEEMEKKLSGMGLID